MELFKILREEARNLRKYPWSFAIGLVVIASLTFMVVNWHYAQAIQAKDSTIQSREAVIQSKEETITTKERALQSIQQTVSAKDDLIISLTNHFFKMVSFQDDLSVAQGNLLKQQKKLEDMEYWIQDFYGKMTTDTINAADKNRLLFIPGTNNTVNVVFRLAHYAIPGTVKVFANAGDGIVLRQQIGGFQNTIDANLHAIQLQNFNTNTLSLEVEYAKDLRKTNLYQEMPAATLFEFVDKPYGNQGKTVIFHRLRLKQ